MKTSRSISSSNPTPDGEYLLEMRDITKTFPGVKAVNGVSLKVRPATVHALVGENGAGKSTMMKILAGEHRPDSGEIFFDGQKVEIGNTKDALRIGISTIYQELNLVPEMTIADNLFLGMEPKEKNRLFVDAGYIHEQTARYIADVGLSYSPKTKLSQLSVSAQQMIEIAKGIHRGARLIVMDEPTSAITEVEVETLFRLIGDLKAKGITFIYISHKLEEIIRISDEVTVMRDGAWVTTQPTREMTQAKIISYMVGRELKHLFPKTDVEPGEVVLEVKGLTRAGVFQDASFQIRKGEILGMAGLMGAGRTEIARAIFGLDRIDAGEIWLEGKPLKVEKPWDAIRHGIAYVPEDRKLIGLCLDRPIIENIGLASLEMFSRLGFLDLKRERSEAQGISDKLQTKAPSLDVPVHTLSGGNQQKVVLSKWLIRNLKVLILDEPTRGIDVGAKSEIHRLMSEFAGHGMAVIMISSELPEILGMSDRILVVHKGRIQGELMRREATQERIMTIATGADHE